MPTGRIYKYEPKPDWRGEMKSPITRIKNYPVQGLGADIMAIARVSFFKRWNKCGDINGVLINTVHDSIVCDIHPSEVERVCGIYKAVFKSLPTNFRRVFGVEFNLPLLCEVKVGENTLDMKEI
jgi:DNA polymerase I-like protein with 3'-5' exonuclease and polymerase domains